MKLKVFKKLFLIAENGLISIKGTCLYAAAWKTISILSFLKIFVIEEDSSNPIKWKIIFFDFINFDISWLSLYKLYSLLSISINFLKLYFNICFIIPEPILPPAPVIKIVFVS